MRSSKWNHQLNKPSTVTMTTTTSPNMGLGLGLGRRIETHRIHRKDSMNMKIRPRIRSLTRPSPKRMSLQEQVVTRMTTYKSWNHPRTTTRSSIGVRQKTRSFVVVVVVVVIITRTWRLGLRSRIGDRIGVVTFGEKLRLPRRLPRLKNQVVVDPAVVDQERRKNIPRTRQSSQNRHPAREDPPPLLPFPRQTRRSTVGNSMRIPFNYRNHHHPRHQHQHIHRRPRTCHALSVPWVLDHTLLHTLSCLRLPNRCRIHYLTFRMLVVLMLRTTTSHLHLRLY